MRLDRGLTQLLPGVGNAQQCGHRDRRAPGDVVVRGARIGTDPGARRERRADPRAPVARPEPFDVEIGHRNEVVERPFAPDQVLRIELHRELAERQFEGAGAQVDRLPVLRGETLDEPPIVEVGGDADPRVEAEGPFVPGLGEQEGIRVHRGGQVVRAIAGAIRALERQLGEGEDLVRSTATVNHRGVQRRQRALGVRAEALRQVPAMQDVLGREARMAGREHVARQLTDDVARALPLDLHGNSAGARQHQHDDERCTHSHGRHGFYTAPNFWQMPIARVPFPAAGASDRAGCPAPRPTADSPRPLDRRARR